MAVEALEENPLRAGLRSRRKPDPSAIVVFGVTGDLTHRKLVPSLYRLYAEGLLPAGFAIVGVARRDWDDGQFRDTIRGALDEFLGDPVREEVWQGFAAGLRFCPGEFDDPETYRRLGEVLAKTSEERVHSGNRLYYLAVPPSVYAPIIDGLGGADLGRDGASHGWSRIVVEKPFGHDGASARLLNARLRRWFREDQIYRIDHYLGKETVQNILVFRLANGIFEPVWNRQYIDNVQITVAEDIGVESRGPYYEEAGAIRDMIQNHVLQLLALIAMEPPVAFDAVAVRDEKVKVFRSLHPLIGSDVDRSVVRGQYSTGLSHGEPVAGYQQEEGVAEGSLTETFVAMRVFLDTWRWAGVPFYLRTGKRMPKRVTEISLQFKQPPLLLFGRGMRGAPEPNVLAVQVQPDEGITLKFGSKVPGPTERVHPVHMDFRYGTSFGEKTSEAYERLILDCLIGDSTLFTRDDGVEAAWGFVDPIVARWYAVGTAPAPYEAGSWGPDAAEDLVDRDKREWRRL